MSQYEKAVRVCDLLEQEYHSPRLYNKSDPMDELLFIILSLRTDERVYLRVYETFKDRYPHWADVYPDCEDNIAEALRGCGLEKQKAKHLKQTINKIMDDFGVIDLRGIEQLDDHEMERYLKSLPGVGLKTAKCIMMYSFGRKVLPIDTHTWRISERLGFINKNMTETMAYKTMDGLIEPDLRYGYHVNCVSHGRSICKAINPNCKMCQIKDYCKYYKLLS
jgi:endonuclease III